MSLTGGAGLDPGEHRARHRAVPARHAADARGKATMGTGFDDTRVRALDAVVGRHVRAGAAPGAVWLVARHGDVHVGSTGATQLDGSVPVDRRTIFRISSMSKPITAALVMTCVEDCTLRLDDPIAEHLPELAEPRVLEHLDAPLTWTVPVERPITTRDLLTSTAGYGAAFAEPGTLPIADAMTELELGQGPPDPWEPPQPDEWLRRLATLPLLHQPGAAWSYNTCSDLLGVLVARATGKPLLEALRERLFAPFGMHDTAFHVPAADLDRFVTAYWTDADDGSLSPYDPPQGRWASPPAFPSAAGGLVSTIDDLHAFARMLLDGGIGANDRVLSRASVDLMTSDHLTAAQRASTGMPGAFVDTSWGFGLQVQTRRTGLGPTVGAYGWDGGLGTAWTIDPAEGLVAILLTQAAWTSPAPPAICDDFRTATYAALTDT
jgi:CubicO group peptidase (beta-lactamase class C family)